eukprot:COSAG06_NODE_5446_length_3479_cov_1.700888_1_plen_175_part_10
MGRSVDLWPPLASMERMQPNIAVEAARRAGLSVDQAVALSVELCAPPLPTVRPDAESQPVESSGPAVDDALEQLRREMRMSRLDLDKMVEAHGCNKARTLAAMRMTQWRLMGGSMVATAPAAPTVARVPTEPDEPPEESAARRQLRLARAAAHKELRATRHEPAPPSAAGGAAIG